jgi:hypothetical protein
VGIEDDAKLAARAAESAAPFEWLARAGFAAVGVIHVLVGAFVLALAFGAHADGSQSGALEAIASAPAGFVVLWALAVTLWCLAVWEALDGVLARGSAPHRWQRRVSDWSRAVVYLVLGGIAVAVALGSRPDANHSAQDVSRRLLAVDGGVFVLGAIGVAIGIAGVVFVVIGVRRGFRRKLTLPPGPLGRLTVVLGTVGYAAKGLALAVVGVLGVVAAVKADPDAAGGLDAAMSALLALPLGPLLTGLVGLGFVVYGLFCFLRARFARLWRPRGPEVVERART